MMTCLLPSHSRAADFVEHSNKPGAIEEHALIEIEKRGQQREEDLISMRDGIQTSRHDIQQTSSRGPRSQARQVAAMEEIQKRTAEENNVEWRKKRKI